MEKSDISSVGIFILKETEEFSTDEKISERIDDLKKVVDILKKCDNYNNYVNQNNFYLPFDGFARITEPDTDDSINLYEKDGNIIVEKEFQDKICGNTKIDDEITSYYRPVLSSDLFLKYSKGYHKLEILAIISSVIKELLFTKLLNDFPPDEQNKHDKEIISMFVFFLKMLRYFAHFSLDENTESIRGKILIEYPKYLLRIIRTSINIFKQRYHEIPAKDVNRSSEEYNNITGTDVSTIIEKNKKLTSNDELDLYTKIDEYDRKIFALDDSSDFNIYRNYTKNSFAVDVEQLLKMVELLYEKKGLFWFMIGRYTLGDSVCKEINDNSIDDIKYLLSRKIEAFNDSDAVKKSLKYQEMIARNFLKEILRNNDNRRYGCYLRVDGNIVISYRRGDDKYNFTLIKYERCVNGEINPKTVNLKSIDNIIAKYRLDETDFIQSSTDQYYGFDPRLNDQYLGVFLEKAKSSKSSSLIEQIINIYQNWISYEKEGGIDLSDSKYAYNPFYGAKNVCEVLNLWELFKNDIDQMNANEKIALRYLLWACQIIYDQMISMIDEGYIKMDEKINKDKTWKCQNYEDSFTYEKILNLLNNFLNDPQVKNLLVFNQAPQKTSRTTKAIRILLAISVITLIIVFLSKILSPRREDYPSYSGGGDSDTVLNKWKSTVSSLGLSKMKTLLTGNNLDKVDNLIGLENNLIKMVVDGFNSAKLYDLVPDFIIASVVSSKREMPDKFKELAEKVRDRGLKENTIQWFRRKLNSEMSEFYHEI